MIIASGKQEIFDSFLRVSRDVPPKDSNQPLLVLVFGSFPLFDNGAIVEEYHFWLFLVSFFEFIVQSMLVFQVLEVWVDSWDGGLARRNNVTDTMTLVANPDGGIVVILRVVDGPIDQCLNSLVPLVESVRIVHGFPGKGKEGKNLFFLSHNDLVEIGRSSKLLYAVTFFGQFVPSKGIWQSQDFIGCFLDAQALLRSGEIQDENSSIPIGGKGVRIFRQVDPGSIVQFYLTREQSVALDLFENVLVALGLSIMEANLDLDRFVLGL